MPKNFIPFAAAFAIFSGAVFADNLDPYWQNQRDYFNLLTDRACVGDRSAYDQIWQAAWDDVNAVALNNVAWMILHQDRCSAAYVSRDKAVAREAIRISAESGYPLAQYSESDYQLAAANGDAEKQMDALMWLADSANGGYAEAAAMIAEAHALGLYGLNRNTQIAEEWLQEARRLGVSDQRINELLSMMSLNPADNREVSTASVNGRYRFARNSDVTFVVDASSNTVIRPAANHWEAIILGQYSVDTGVNYDCNGGAARVPYMDVETRNVVGEFEVDCPWDAVIFSHRDDETRSLVRNYLDGVAYGDLNGPSTSAEATFAYGAEAQIWLVATDWEYQCGETAGFLGGTVWQCNSRQVFTPVLENMSLGNPSEVVVFNN